MQSIRASVLLLLVLLTACGRSSAPQTNPTDSGKYQVDITRTSLGIPHIKAADFGSMGYGYGYAFAEDNLCVLQEDLLTIRGERAKYLGRSGSYTIVPNGVVADNVTSDYFWKFLATDEVVDKLRAKALPELRDATSGFVAGYNRYIRELKAGQHPGRFVTAPDGSPNLGCAKAPWLFEISDADMYRRYFRLSVIASSSALVNEIVAAQPPSGVAARSKPRSNKQLARLLKNTPSGLLTLSKHEAFASNMYAFGKDATTTGQPMLWGNPHFPWTGTERLYISHLTIPGKLDIMGSSLYGVPAVLIGFTDNFAWSHTVSTAYRFTLYELTLDPSSPTKYMYDGASRAMTAVPISIDIKEADGTISHTSKTLYRSHYGPMLTVTASGVPVLGWNNAKAYTLRDANAENDRLINQFAQWDQAKSLDEFKALHKSILGVPWVNTVATGPGGKAYYGDITVVPNVPDAKSQACTTALTPAVQQLLPGLPLLDGSRSSCEWDTDADAPAPGIFGPSHLPTLERDDFVHNCNDSYWLTNPAQPITGYARIIGDENSARSLRTRLCILQAQRRLAGSDDRAGNKMDLKTLQEIGLSSQIYSSELARATVISNLCTQPTAPSSSGPVDTAAACTALQAWDGHDNLDSKGGHLWREFWRKVSGGPLPVRLAALGNSYWSMPYSGSDPVNTPNTLNTSMPAVQMAFGDAINTVKASGHPFDAALGTLQHPCCIDKSIPIFGGEDFEGAFTVVDGTNVLDADGYRVPYGNSYIQAVTWDDKGVIAEGFITYSQSTDPANPHFSDFTREYSAKRWHRFPYHAADVKADQVSQMRLTE